MTDMCRIETDQIVIRVPIDALRGAVAAGPDAEHMRVTDEETFARELVRELLRETEDGTTPIHRMLDAACLAVFENGGEGCEEQDPVSDHLVDANKKVGGGE